MSGDYQGRNNRVDTLVVSNMRLAYAMAKRRSPRHLREDAAQEGAIKLWQAAQKYDPEKGSFSSYASTCIGRRIMDFTKTERRRGSHFEPFDSFEHDCKYEPTSLDRIISSEDRSNISELRKAVQSLPLYERHVITFHYGLYEEEPRTLIEIGSMLKMPASKVRTIKAHALKNLREILAQD